MKEIAKWQHMQREVTAQMQKEAENWKALTEPMRSLNFRNKNNKESNHIRKKTKQLNKPRKQAYFKKTYMLAYPSWKYICWVQFLTGCTGSFKG